jgi:metallo-beta-lactamase class B
MFRGMPKKILVLLAIPAAVVAQAPDTVRVAYSAAACSSCATWNVPHRPFRIYGNTYYVGTQGLSAILVTSNEGHVLIDGALPQSAPLIAANIQALGFRIEDVKLILNSHDHFDHAGGIAELQRRSGARVAASASSADVLRRGASGSDDPQYAIALKFPPARVSEVIADGETVHVGPLAMTAHTTAGHTPGGTSWTWRSCDGGHCLDIVYADSQTPVSADGFFFTRSAAYPSAIADFEHGFSTIEGLRCDVLLTPHPDASDLFARVTARDGGDASALVDPTACKRFVAAARKRLAQRIATERAAP